MKKKTIKIIMSVSLWGLAALIWMARETPVHSTDWWYPWYLSRSGTNFGVRYW